MPGLTFMDLPGEIRNIIYHHLLVIPSPSNHTSLFAPTSVYPSLLLANRQIHHEASQILYGCNTFFAHISLLSSLPQLRRHYASITSPRCIAEISKYHMCVRLDCDAHFTKEQASEAFSGVEELTIEVFEAQFGSSGYEVLRLFEDVREVGKARIVGSTAAHREYVEWLVERMGCAKDEKRLGWEEEGHNQVVGPYDVWVDGGR